MIAQIKKMHTCINIGFEYYYVLLKKTYKIPFAARFFPQNKT